MTLVCSDIFSGESGPSRIFSGRNITVTCPSGIAGAGATGIDENRFPTGATSPGSDFDRKVGTLYSLSAADYIQVQVYTSNDVDVVASSNFSPEFWAIWQRRA